MAATSHLVLARKWRPERFADLVGQERVTRTLSQALTSGRIAHAFLFTGIRGVGKTTAARVLARCLNCINGPTPEPCGECSACVEIRQGRALDVVEIDGATYRKIDDARTIIENLSYRPARDRFKIYIIDEAHQLTDQAFNALLKTLEEPPPHIKFILATTEPQKMPETILSRLQRYDFRRIPFTALLDRLRDLAGREGIEIEAGALVLIAREAGGSMRDAERMLETALALSAGPISEVAVADSLGVASRQRVYDLAEAILNHAPAQALAIVGELHQQGANLQGLGRDLLETMRNLVVAKLPQSQGQERGQALSPLADLPDHEADTLRRLAQNPSMRDLMRLFRLMAQAQEEILRSPFADLLLEMTTVRMATIAPVLDGDELMGLLKSLAGTAPGSGGSPPPSSARGPATPASSTPPPMARRMKVEGEVKASAPPRTAPVPVAAPSGAAPTGDQAPLREYIRAKKAALAGFMEHGAALSLDGDLLQLTPLSDIYVRYLADNKAALATLASEFFGRTIKVQIQAVQTTPSDSQAPASDSAPTADHPPASPEPRIFNETVMAAASETRTEAAGEPVDREQTRKELYADPMVRKILDEFEGRLVDVKRLALRADKSQ